MTDREWLTFAAFLLILVSGIVAFVMSYGPPKFTRLNTKTGQIEVCEKLGAVTIQGQMTCLEWKASDVH